MNADKKYEISVLAEDAHHKSERFKLLGLQNTPTDYDAATKARIEYELARAEMMEAEGRLFWAQLQACR